jgi:hypothetical protein
MQFRFELNRHPGSVPENLFRVMPGLDPGIHAATSQRAEAPSEWIAGSSPAMTKGGKSEVREGSG